MGIRGKKGINQRGKKSERKYTKKKKRGKVRITGDLSPPVCIIHNNCNVITFVNKR